jgi:hypothetical protein
VAATVVFDGTNVTEASSTTNWDSQTITAPELWTEVYIQNSNSIGFQANNKDGYGWFDYSGTGSFDFTSGGTHEGQHIFIWINCTTMGGTDLVANNGLYLMFGSSDTDFDCYVIGGSDALERYAGGWARFALDPRKTATFQMGSGATKSSVSRFGVGIEMTTASRSDNLFVDRIDVGWGLRIYGTSTDGWADVVDADMNTTANVYGILQEKEGIYYSYGRLEVGDNVSTNGTTFSDTDRIIRWVSQQYYSSGGSWVDMIGDDFFKLSIVSNSTNATNFTDGIQVGTGDTSRGRNGSVFLGSDLHITNVSLADTNNAANTLNLYGTTFRYMAGGVSARGDSDHKLYGCIIDQCGIFDPGGPVSIRNSTFSSTTDDGYSGSSFYWTPSGIDIKNSSFIANTHATYDPHGILHTASGIVQYDNLKFAGNDYDIALSGVLSTDFLTVESINTSDPGTYEVIYGSGVSIDNAVFLTVNVENNVGTAISGVAVAIYTASGTVTQLMNEFTTPAGQAQESYNYLGTMPITIRLRKSSAGDTRYYPITAVGEIGSTGFTLTAVMSEDIIAA